MYRYSDDEYEYRHVQLPKNMLKAIPKEYHDPSKGTLKLLWEEEWRGLGITQVWQHCSLVAQVLLTLLHRVLVGSTTKFMSPSHTSCCSSKSFSLQSRTPYTVMLIVLAGVQSTMFRQVNKGRETELSSCELL